MVDQQKATLGRIQTLCKVPSEKEELAKVETKIVSTWLDLGEEDSCFSTMWALAFATDEEGEARALKHDRRSITDQSLI